MNSAKSLEEDWDSDEVTDLVKTLQPYNSLIIRCGITWAGLLTQGNSEIINAFCVSASELVIIYYSTIENENNNFRCY